MVKGQLKKVYDKLDRERQEVAEQYEQANQALSNEKHQLQQLRDYENQYNSDITTHKGQQSADNISRYRNFYHQIGSLVIEQEQKMVQAESYTNTLRELLFQYKKKLELIEKLSDKKNHQAALEDDKRLQKEIDELMSRASSQRSSLGVFK